MAAIGNSGNQLVLPTMQSTNQYKYPEYCVPVHDQYQSVLIIDHVPAW